MSADLRRFDYALEPLLRQRQWRLEASRARLARVQGEVHAAEEALEALRERYRAQRQLAAEALETRLDPGSYPRLLRWLVQLRDTIRSGEASLAELHARRSEASADCLEQQRKVEVVERHRDDCVADFARDEQGRLATEADRDWLARRDRGDGAAAADDTPGGRTP
jgi:flagellar biosynthesis chaperone FliJ